MCTGAIVCLGVCRSIPRSLITHSIIFFIYLQVFFYIFLYFPVLYCTLLYLSLLPSAPWAVFYTKKVLYRHWHKTFLNLGATKSLYHNLGAAKPLYCTYDYNRVLLISQWFFTCERTPAYRGGSFLILREQTAPLTTKSYDALHTLHRRRFPCDLRYFIRILAVWLLQYYTSHHY